MIDLPELFTEIGVKFWTSGKNVSTGWIGIRCVYCNDSSNHLGVSLQHGNFSCWKCGSTGSLKQLLMEMGYSYHDTKDLISRHSTEADIRVQQNRQRVERVQIEGFGHELHTAQREYLIKRGFDPDYIQKKYQIMGGSPLMGHWRGRIIVPVIMEGELFTFTGMSYCGQDPKYLHNSEEKSVRPAKECLYNWDSVRGDQIAIVEGVTDSWRCGDGFVAVFGTKFTQHQIRLIVKRKLRRAFVLYDADAPDIGKRLAHQLASFSMDVELLLLEEGDPADQKESEIIKLRNDLGFH